jgi:CheY-like chemotaxis protein
MSKSCKILVGEDDVEDQGILEDYFREKGFTACAFEKNGKKVLEYLEQIRNETDLPRLIVLDLNMPILNGTQTLHRLKQDPRLNKIPVIIYSTSKNEHEKRKCLSLGAVDYLIKPHTVDEGHGMVKKILDFVTV